MRRLGLEPKKLGKAAVQKSWQLMQEEAGVTQDAIIDNDETSASSLPEVATANEWFGKLFEYII